MEILERQIKSTMNGIFRRLRLRIKPEILCELINTQLIIYVKIPHEKLLFMEMTDISKSDIGNEFFNRISQRIVTFKRKSSDNNSMLKSINIKFEQKE